MWIDALHNTRDVRQRIDELKNVGQEIHSVWSGCALKHQYHVDHCLPFAYWPNNDKWNLLPTTVTLKPYLRQWVYKLKA